MYSLGTLYYKSPWLRASYSTVKTSAFHLGWHNLLKLGSKYVLPRPNNHSQVSSDAVVLPSFRTPRGELVVPMLSCRQWARCTTVCAVCATSLRFWVARHARTPAFGRRRLKYTLLPCPADAQWQPSLSIFKSNEAACFQQLSTPHSFVHFSVQAPSSITPDSIHSLSQCR